MAALTEILRTQEGMIPSRDGTTLCAARGEYTFLYCPVTRLLIVSVIRGNNLPDKNELKAFAKERSELRTCTIAGTRALFSVRGGSAKKIAERIHTLLPELLFYLHSHGYQNCCEMTRTVGPTVGCMSNGNPHLVAEEKLASLSREEAQKLRAEEEKGENFACGTLFAVVGGLIGAAVIVLFARLGCIAVISGIILGCCTVGGYRKGAGRLSGAGIGLCTVIMIIAVYFGDRVDTAITLSQMLDVSFGYAFRRAHDFLNTASYIENLITLYLLTAVGAVPAIVSIRTNAKQAHVVYRIGE